MPNAIEFVLGSDPSAGANNPALSGEAAAGHYVVSFTRVKAAGAAGFASAIEYSSDMAALTWTAATPAMTQVIDHGDTETATVSIPISNGNVRLFVRLRVTAP